MLGVLNVQHTGRLLLNRFYKMTLLKPSCVCNCLMMIDQSQSLEEADLPRLS